MNLFLYVKRKLLFMRESKELEIESTVIKSMFK